jgi:hypothetical protein
VEWPDEKAYCRVSRAVRFDPSYHAVAEERLAHLGLQRHCAFRRFLADGMFARGNVVSRLEFGFGMRSRFGKSLTPNECIAFVQSALDMPVTLHGDGEPRQMRLLDLGDPFGRLYLRSTTKRAAGQTPAVQPWWFRSAAPLTVVEYALDGPWAELPRGARLVPTLAHTGITLAYATMEMSRLLIGVWLIGLPPHMRDFDLLRRLRINLLRLHAERQSIVEVLRLIRLGKIPVAIGTEPTENLQTYLDKSIKFLKREVRESLPQSELLAASYEAENFVQTGEREALLDKLKMIRGNLFKNLQTYLKNTGTPPQLPVSRYKLFISYSHKDDKFLNELLTHLKPLERAGRITKWSDKEIAPGSLWLGAIQKPLAEAKVAVMLVTKDFLASDFIHEQELAPLLKDAATGGVSILWVLVKDCNWKQTPLKDLQAAYSTEKALTKMKDRDTAWVAICDKILDGLRAQGREGI